jgi:hypothetical protein
MQENDYCFIGYSMVTRPVHTGMLRPSGGDLVAPALSRQG